MNKPLRILALCATYNRRDVTLSSLRSLQTQALPFGVTMHVAVVDDASTDGTLTAVRNDFPDVSTMEGGGGLFWAGAMRLGFRHFWDAKKYTHLLVFNDDVILYPGAINMLLDAYKTHLDISPSVERKGVVVVGSFNDGTNDKVTYGGYIRRKGLKPVILHSVQPTDKQQFADTLNMNFALIDRACLSKHELIGEHFSHSLADFDFGLRVSRDCVPVIVAPGFQGVCLRNSKIGTWEDDSLRLSVRLRLMRAPKGIPLLPRYIYLKNHTSILWPIYIFWPYIRVIFGHVFLGLIRRKN